MVGVSSRLRMFARWITAVALAAAYAALHLLVNVGVGQQVRASRAGALWCGAVALALLGPALWLRHRRRSGVAEIVALVDRYGTRRPRCRRAVLAANTAGCVLAGGGALAVAVSERSAALPPEASLLLLAGGVAAAGPASWSCAAPVRTRLAGRPRPCSGTVADPCSTCAASTTTRRPPGWTTGRGATSARGRCSSPPRWAPSVP